MATGRSKLVSFDNDLHYVSQVGHVAVFDEISKLLTRHNASVEATTKLFVEGETEAYSVKFYDPVGGEMQVVGREAPAGAMKRVGDYTVNLPLIGSEVRMATDRVNAGYMTVPELNAQVESMFTLNAVTVRRALLSAMLINTPRAFTDKEHGALTISPLADGDATIYPPVIGSAAATTLHQHYVRNTLTLANFNTNLNNLLEHFGWSQEGDPVVCLCHPTEGAIISGFAGWRAYRDPKTLSSVATTWTNTIADAPGITTGSVAGCWINEWRWMPQGWMIFIHLGSNVMRPLYMRVDPAGTGLGRGLQLVATETQYPIENSFWQHRFGFGVVNRLNGVVVKVADAGAYTIPTAPVDYTYLRYGAAS